MAVNFGEGLVAFLSGVQEGGEKIDEKLALQMKAIKDSNSDENLKSKYTSEFAKFEKNGDLVRSIESAGGLGTLKGLQLAGGYDSLDELKKALDLDPTLINKIKMPTLGEAPVYTPSTYGVTNLTAEGKSRSTVSKAFNSLFRPEVFEENEAYADANPATEGTTTTYRRGKGTDITSDQESNLRKSLQRLRIKNQPQQLKKKIQTEEGGWEEVTFTRNEDGTTGNKAKELGGKYSLYAGYSVTTTDPWQNPTEQKDGTIFDYTMMFAVDSNGDFIDDDALTRSDMKQAPFNVKAYKTGDPKDKIQIQGGMLEGYIYLERSIIPDVPEEDGRTTTRKNLDDDITDMLADYKEPGRTAMYDANLKRLGYTEMNEISAKGLINNYNSMVQNANTGNVLNMDDYFMGNVENNSRQSTFVANQPAAVAEITVEYLPSQAYFNDLSDSSAYETFINGQAQYFANNNRISIPEAVDAVETMAKLGITNTGNALQEGLSKINFANVYEFDRKAILYREKNEAGQEIEYTVADLIKKMTKLQKETKLPWSKVSSYMVKEVNKQTPVDRALFPTIVFE